MSAARFGEDDSRGRSLRWAGATEGPAAKLDEQVALALGRELGTSLTPVQESEASATVVLDSEAGRVAAVRAGGLDFALGIHGHRENAAQLSLSRPYRIESGTPEAYLVVGVSSSRPELAAAIDRAISRLALRGELEVLLQEARLYDARQRRLARWTADDQASLSSQPVTHREPSLPEWGSTLGALGVVVVAIVMFVTWRNVRRRRAPS